jgi:hypothetical protein
MRKQMGRKAVEEMILDSNAKKREIAPKEMKRMGVFLTQRLSSAAPKAKKLKN